MEPIVSVIMPVYNGQKYIERAVESVLQQTLKNLELIVVDDASTDRTGEILDAFSRKDSRVRVVHLEKNSSCFLARKTGTMLARGEYVMFLDCDDAFLPNACERATELISKHKVDIFHFEVELSIANETDKEPDDNNPEDAKWKGIRDFIRPYVGRLSGERVLRGCFEQGLFSQSMWNKIYKRTICQQGVSACPDLYVNMSEDVLIFFHIAYYARSYMGECTEPLYLYTVGSGMSTRNDVTYKQVKNLIDSLAVPDAIQKFLKSNGKFEYYRKLYERIYRRILEGTLYNASLLLRTASPGIAGKALDQLLDTCDNVELVGELAARFFFDPGIVYQAMANTRLNEPVLKPVRTVATFYHGIAKGGAERVVAYLVALWRRMGYRVVLFTDLPASINDFDIDAEYIRCVLPTCHSEEAGCDYTARGKVLKQALQDNQVDLMVYHAWLSPYLPWDMMLCRMIGTAFCVHMHSAVDCLQYADNGSKYYYAQLPIIYSLAEGALALNKTDAALWQLCTRWTYVVKNPLVLGTADFAPRNHCGRKILWVGRFSEEKRVWDALYIFQKISSRFSDATLTFAGECDAHTEEKMYRLVKSMGLANQVTFVGFQQEMEPIYLQADILLCTSKYEGFPLAILEAQAAGLPVVMYELPYLTLAEGNAGLVAVEQGSQDEAAEAIARLFEDDTLYDRLSHEGVANAEKFASIDQSEQWRIILTQIERPNPLLNEATPDQKSGAGYWFRFTLSGMLSNSGGIESNAGARMQLEHIYSMRTWKVLQKYTHFMDTTKFGKILCRIRDALIKK